VVIMVKWVSSAGAVVLGTAVLMSASAVRADCKLVQIAEFHVDPKSATPIVDGEINGQPVKIMFDIGNTTSTIPVSEAKRLGLRMSRLEGVRMYGFGGDTAAYDATVKELEIGAFKANNVELVAAGSEHAISDVALMLGDDFFSRTDVEFDLRDNVVRLFDPQGCTPPQLVYWGHAYSQAKILPWDRDNPATQISATINGRQILTEFDTGAYASVIDQVAAETAGVSRADGQPTEVAHGIGPKAERVWVGRFDDLQLGDEKLSNIRLSVENFASGWRQAETDTKIARQLESTPYLFIGADFFHAHRVFIDNKDHLILFSYEGGPVFRQAETAPGAAGH
jgi:predicted aspartyl protease